jgi:hypothetical protein
LGKLAYQGVAVIVGVNVPVGGSGVGSGVSVDVGEEGKVAV